MVAAQDVDLCQEGQRRDPEVPTQSGGQGIEGSDQIREEVPEGLEHRIVVPDGIQAHGTGHRVHGGLDTVAQVADPSHALQRDVVGHGERGRCRVPVEHPDQAPLVNDGVGVRVPEEERGELAHPLPDGAAEDETAVPGHLTREEEVLVAEAPGEGEDPEERAEDHAGGVVGARLAGEGAVPPGDEDGILAHLLAEEDARILQGHGLGRRGVAYHRVDVAKPLARLGGGHGDGRHDGADAAHVLGVQAHGLPGSCLGG